MMIHEHERGADSQQHLDENKEKLNTDVQIIMQLLYSGHRLSARDVVVKYGLHDRRLRDAIKARPDLIKKEWVLKTNGKRDYVVYFIPKFQLPTKSAVVEKAGKVIEMLKSTASQMKMF